MARAAKILNTVAHELCHRKLLPRSTYVTTDINCSGRLYTFRRDQESARQGFQRLVAQDDPCYEVANAYTTRRANKIMRVRRDITIATKHSYEIVKKVSLPSQMETRVSLPLSRLSTNGSASTKLVDRCEPL